MTVQEMAMILLLGLSCGTIHGTEPLASHSVYGKYDELNMRLQESCIRSKLREPWVRKIEKI